MPSNLSGKRLREAISGTAAAFRLVIEHQPAGGAGDKVFPPTYEGGAYAEEIRRIDGKDIPCVLLDSVQSQANRMEEALQVAIDGALVSLPIVVVDFSKAGLLKDVGRITSLETPHRIVDAILRDSQHGGTPFRTSEIGRSLDGMSTRNATPLYDLCPTALIFGLWDSTGPRGGLGAKFQRAIVSEIVGINAVTGRKTSSRIDPLAIQLAAGPLYETTTGGWTVDKNDLDVKRKGKEPQKLGKDGKPSEANHGNVTPSISDVGGVTIDRAVQTTVLSLPALRRLRFPLTDKTPTTNIDDAGRTVLAALGITAAVLATERGFDLRSRCLLHPTGPLEWELLDVPGTTPERFTIDRASAIQLLEESVASAEEVGLHWRKDPIMLEPSPQLIELVRRSQELEVSSRDGEA